MFVYLQQNIYYFLAFSDKPIHFSSTRLAIYSYYGFPNGLMYVPSDIKNKEYVISKTGSVSIFRQQSV